MRCHTARAEGSREESSKEEVREGQGLGNFYRQLEFGFDVAEMGFDQGSESVDVDSRKMGGWWDTGRGAGGEGCMELLQ